MHLRDMHLSLEMLTKIILLNQTSTIKCLSQDPPGRARGVVDEEVHRLPLRSVAGPDVKQGAVR